MFIEFFVVPVRYFFQKLVMDEYSFTVPPLNTVDCIEFDHVAGVQEYLSVGPPVYFVVNNTAGQLDLTKESDQNKLCLGLPGNRYRYTRSAERRRHCRALYVKDSLYLHLQQTGPAVSQTAGRERFHSTVVLIFYSPTVFDSGLFLKLIFDSKNR